MELTSAIQQDMQPEDNSQPNYASKRTWNVAGLQSRVPTHVCCQPVTAAAILLLSALTSPMLNLNAFPEIIVNISSPPFCWDTGLHLLRLPRTLKVP